jgi:hypothetical protein
MRLPPQIEGKITEIPWTRSVAAGSLIVSALLLISGKRKSGIAVAAAGATIALLENPEAVRNAWESMPRFVRAGQDFLLRVEDFVDELNKQGARLRKVLTPE